MTLDISKKAINRSQSFALQEKRTLREVVDAIFSALTINSSTNVAVNNLTAAGTITGDRTGPAITTAAGAGITGGTGTVVSSNIIKTGNKITTQIFVDLTGLDSDAALGDIIGLDGTSDPCHFGAIDVAESGALYGGSVTCIEAPAGGEPDIDLYAADEATGVTDGAIGDLAETALLASAADWAALASKALTAVPADGQYLYLTVGTASAPVAGTYTAGQFLIELYGYEA